MQQQVVIFQNICFFRLWYFLSNLTSFPCEEIVLLWSLDCSFREKKYLVKSLKNCRNRYNGNYFLLPDSIIIFLSNLLLCGGGGIFSVKWHGFDGLIAAYNRNWIIYNAPGIWNEIEIILVTKAAKIPDTYDFPNRHNYLFLP